MRDITVPVEEDRIEEFYRFFIAWLASGAVVEADGVPTATASPVGQPVGNVEGLAHWGEDDEALALDVWRKLSPPAQAMFKLLIETRGRPLTAAEIARRLDVEKGKYGVAGILAWPGRHSNAVGRHLPVHYREGTDGEGAEYWIYPDVAALFAKAAERDGEQD